MQEEFGVSEQEVKAKCLEIGLDPEQPTDIRCNAVARYCDLAEDEEIFLRFLRRSDSNDRIQDAYIVYPLKCLHSFENKIRFASETLEWQASIPSSEKGSVSIYFYWTGVFNFRQFTNDNRNKVLEMYHRELLSDNIRNAWLADLFLCQYEEGFSSGTIRQNIVRKWSSAPAPDEANGTEDYYWNHFQKAHDDIFPNDRHSKEDENLGPAETVNPTGSATPEKIDGSCNPSPWCFAGLILPLGLAAWWIFRRK